jgi:hypothetical protein
MMPSENTIAQLQTIFFNSFEHHIFLKSVGIANFTLGHSPPYLELALACLGSISADFTDATNDIVTLERSQADVSAELFIAGVNLWSVMLEVDNRESRFCAATIAVRISY